MQTFNPYPTANSVETYTTQVQKTDEKGNPLKGADGKPLMQDVTVNTQPIPVGPAASQIAIKQLGTNGGGFYDQNSAHPFENPTPLSNFVELFSLIIVASALIYTFGLMVSDLPCPGYFRSHAGSAGGIVCGRVVGRTQPNPVMQNIHPNMEGKEQRLAS